VLDVFLALDGKPNVVVLLRINESLQPVCLRKTIDYTLAMFPSAAREIACDPDIQGAVGSIC